MFNATDWVMRTETESLPIHARKRYRVVLDGFDPAKETEESFALKLSMRMRTPMPRVRQVLKNLPRPLREGLTSTQANRLKTVIESLGGRARVEMHIVVPGDPAHVGDRDSAKPGRAPRASRARRERKRCSECGWDEEGDATYCGLCHHRFGPQGEGDVGMGILPDENPLGPSPTVPHTAGERVAPRRRQLAAAAIIGGVALLMILLRLVK